MEVWMQILIGILVSVCVSAIGYLTVSNRDQGKAITELTLDMNYLKEAFKEMSTDMKLFLKSEIDTLKALADRANDN